MQEIVTHRVNANASWGAAATVSYLQGPQGPLYRHLSGTTDVSWYVYDGLGSVVGEVDVTGNLTATKSHDVYGLTRSVTGNPTSRHGFVGGLGHTEDDETGYVYMRARHYDPETGRFASEDTAHDGSNWFTYCANEPINRIDPSGKVIEILAPTVEECAEKIEEIAQATALRGKALQVVKMIDLRMAAMGSMMDGLFADGRGGQLVLRYYSSITGSAQTFRFDVTAGAIDLKGFASNAFNTSGSGHAWQFAQVIQEVAEFYK